jgi:hypothetical protein
MCPECDIDRNIFAWIVEKKAKCRPDNMTGVSFFTSIIDRVVARIEILTSNIAWLFFAFRADNLPGLLQSGSFWHTV